MQSPGAMVRAILRVFSTPNRVWQQRLFLLFLAAYLIELANSLYLVTFSSLRFSYMMMVLFHVVFGFLLTALLVSYGISHILTIQNRHHTKGIRTGIGIFIVLLLCFGLGIYLTFAGVPRHNIWKLYLHGGAGVVALLFFGLHLLTIPPLKESKHFQEIHFSNGTLTLMAGGMGGGIVLFLIGFILYDTLKMNPHSAEAIEYSYPVLWPELSYDEQSNPFFPSLATTKTGGFISAETLSGSQSCGTSGCHADLYRQWKSSAHRHSSFNNPFYRRATEYMGERVGYPPTKFCGGCHDPLLIFSGKMDERVDSTSWEANAGITCISCHSIVEIRDLRGNGSYVIESPRRYPFASSESAILRRETLVVDRQANSTSGPNHCAPSDPSCRCWQPTLIHLWLGRIGLS